MEVETYFLSLGPKITENGECSHEIRRCLLLGRKFITNIDSVEKLRHYFANKCSYSQDYGFSSGRIGSSELDCTKDREPKN